MHGLQVTVLAASAPPLSSAGQVALEPVHVSAGSHSPVEARHVAPALPAGCVQAEIGRASCRGMYGLRSSVHAVPDTLLASAGQVGIGPVPVSAGSHSPVEARHVAPPLPAGCVQAALFPSP